MHSIYIHAWITWILILWCIFFITTYANRRAVHSHFGGKVEKIQTIFSKEIKNTISAFLFERKDFHGPVKYATQAPQMEVLKVIGCEN